MRELKLIYYLLRTVWMLLVSLWRAVLRGVRGSAANGWPATDAVIQAVRVPEDDGIYSVSVDYEYCVNQQYYAGSLSRECILPALANRFAERFHVRARYRVHFDPNDPSKSFLPANPILVQTAAAAKS
jgi:uncharacterized protein DUF3592